MVSSYLICDACGNFGPPASFLSENGLRLCCRCWMEAWRDRHPEAAPVHPATTDSDDLVPFKDNQQSS